MAKKTKTPQKKAKKTHSGNDFRNGYSAGYKGYPLTGTRSAEYRKGHSLGHKKGGKRKVRLP